MADKPNIFVSNPADLEYQYRLAAGTHTGQQPSTYAVNFTNNGNEYTFIPMSVIDKGASFNGESYLLPWFLESGNLDKLGKTGQYIDMAGASWYGDYLKDSVGSSTKGFLIPAGSLPFDSKITVFKGNVLGVGDTKEGKAYVVDSQGSDGKYIASDGKITTLTAGHSILGDVFGDFGDSVSGFVNSGLDVISSLGPLGTIAMNAYMPGLGTAVTAGTAAGRGDMTGALITAGIGEATGNSLGNDIGTSGPSIFSGTDPNAVGGVTGPDNIDVGGGFNPATPPVISPVLDSTADNIDVGGGFNPATNAGDVITAEAAANNLPVAPELTASQVTDMIAGENAGQLTAAETQALIDKEAADAAAAASATPAQVAAAKAAGMSTLDYVRAGLLVNAITGDPLKLGGGGGGVGGGGTTGFEQVPIPAEWRSPTYAAPSAPIDLSSIFTDQNLLTGTQWQGLPTQQPNVSFNDIFASGQQQTPMGNMVDINQIVSSILGQNTASQKSS